MITEDYCSFEVAKLLKEKGFDGECVGCYWDSKKTFDVNYEPLSYSDGDLRDEVILAPTHQMAMKWLREKDIDIIIMPLFKLKGGRIYCYEIHSDAEDIRTGQFKTYEEAVEAAIKYYLTNLTDLIEK